MTLQRREFTLGGQFSGDGTTRLEVALLASEGKTRLELRLLGWGEGIGWYIQKRIQLDPHQVRTLKQILGKDKSQVTSSMPKLKMTYRTDQQIRNSPQDLSVSLRS